MSVDEPCCEGPWRRHDKHSRLAPRVPELLAHIAEQHESMAAEYNRFLSDASGQVFQALLVENKRLQTEVARLGGRLRTSGDSTRRATTDPGDGGGVGKGFPKDRFLALFEGFPLGRHLQARTLGSMNSVLAVPAPSSMTVGNRMPMVESLSDKASSCSTSTLGEACGEGHPTAVPDLPGGFADPSDLDLGLDKSPQRPDAVPETRWKSMSSDIENVHMEHRERLRKIFDKGPDEQGITVNELYDVLLPRWSSGELSAAKVATMAHRARDVHARFHMVIGGTQTSAGDNTLELEMLVDLLAISSSIVSQEDDEALNECAELLDALKVVPIEEVVRVLANPSRVTVDTTSRVQTRRQGRRDLWLNGTVSVTVVLNIFSMGLSVDHAPDHVGWLCLDIMCTLVFIVEAVTKICSLGARRYFRGPAAMWNSIEFLLTGISVVDIMFSGLVLAMHGNHQAMATLSGAVRVAVVARVVRVVRVFRLVKLVKSPIIRDFANMLVGLVVGIPSLLWVLILFCAILYVFGIIFRMFLRPMTGELLAARCGLADDLEGYQQVIDGTVCQAHLLYGEEYFGSVPRAMFTAFRFMLCDFTTYNGRSLILAFSKGYGWRFTVPFVVWMVEVIFGYFNIVTAIFVDSTTTGLKHSDFKRKYAQQYEKRHVQVKLEQLVARIKQLHDLFCLEYPEWAGTAGHLVRRSPSSGASSPDVANIAIGAEEFMHIMEDSVVQDLLDALDIGIMNPSGLFDTLDPEGQGTLRLPAIAERIIKLRGEPQKSDIVASWVSLRALHAKFDRLRKDVEKSRAQDRLRGMVGGFSSTLRQTVT